MTLYGIVRRVDADSCVICLEDEGCQEGCSSCAGCSRKTSGREIQALLPQEVTVSVLDRVEVEAPNRVIALSSFLVFLLPCAALVLGYAFGKSFPGGKPVGLLCGLLFLGGAIFLCRLFSGRLARQRKTIYKIARIFPYGEDEISE